VSSFEPLLFFSISEVDSDFVPTQKENLQFEEKIEISKEGLWCLFNDYQI
jgi:hypothetical protein